MGQVALLQSDIGAGALVPLFTPYSRNLGYYAVWSKNAPLARDGRVFLKWLEGLVTSENP
jgi:hypothetical protein